MTGLGVEAVAKKKTASKRTSRKPTTPPVPTPPTGDDRVAVVVLKGSPEYREWLAGISKQSLIPIASIVRDSLAKWAEGRGYPSPPDR